MYLADQRLVASGPDTFLTVASRSIVQTLTALYLIVVCAGVPSCAQSWNAPAAAYIFQQTLAGATPSTLVQAPDGNLYGTASATTQGSGGSTAQTAQYGLVFQLSPTHVLLTVHIFTNGTDGGNPVGPLTVGHDGNLYGITSTGGSSGKGTFFMLTLGTAAHPAVLTTLYSFSSTDPGGVNPLIQGIDGNFYGTASIGGTNGKGAVIELSNPNGTGWTLTQMWPFLGTTDGSTPSGMLLQDSGPYGFLWGTAINGPDNLYKIPPNSLPSHNFYPIPGSLPGASSNFVQDSAGRYYTAFAGNSTYPNGGVFREDHGSPSVIHQFDPNTEGGIPPGSKIAGLIMGSDGNLYGATQSGSTNGLGSIYQMTQTGNTTVVYKLSSGDGAANSLLQASDGTLYVSTAAIASPSAPGKILSISSAPALPAALSLSLSTGNITLGQSSQLSWSLPYAVSGTAQQCYAFVNDPTHAGAWSGKQVGTLNGSVYAGGPVTITPTASGSFTYALSCGGTITASSTLNVGPVTLSAVSHDFGPVGVGLSSTFTLTITHGSVPLTITSTAQTTNHNGLPFTTTSNTCVGPEAIPGDCSVVFAYTPNQVANADSLSVTIDAPPGIQVMYGSTVTNTVTLSGSGQVGLSSPATSPFSPGLLAGTTVSSLVQAPDGNYYGTTSSANSTGSIFQLTPAGQLSIFYSFTSTSSAGNTPAGPLTVGQDGLLYGLTSLGGANGVGTFYRIATTPGATPAVLYQLTAAATDPKQLNPILQASDGNFYGSSVIGGANNFGCVFKFSNGGGTWSWTTLYSFKGGTEGGNPNGPLLEGNNGNFYGTLLNGNIGLFQVSRSGAFYNTGGQPGGSYSNLVQDSTGAVYGTFAGTTQNSAGGIFKESGGSVATLYSFSGGSSDGGHPMTGLILGSDGNLYGTTQQGGANGYGTVFQATTSGVVATYYHFKSTDGVSAANVLEGSDGALRVPVGTSSAGGATGRVITLKKSPVRVNNALSYLPVSLTFSPSSAVAGYGSTTLSWRIPGAYALTPRQCVASVQGGSSYAGVWSGKQTGTVDASGVLTGSATITLPVNSSLTTPTTYTYALNCGGSVAGFATLNVNPPTLSFPTSPANPNYFGPLTAGTTGSITTTLTNQFSTAAPISFTNTGLFTPGAQASDYTITSTTCGSSLAAGQQCQISFQFTAPSVPVTTPATTLVASQYSYQVVSDAAHTNTSYPNLPFIMSGSTIVNNPNGTRFCYAGPKTVFAGGVQNPVTDADLTNTMNLQPLGNASLYMHYYGLVHGYGTGTLKQIFSTMAPTGPGVLELYEESGIPGLLGADTAYVDWQSFLTQGGWAPTEATLNLGNPGGGAIEVNNIGSAGAAVVERDAIVTAQYVRQQGIQYLLPFITPNWEGDSVPNNNETPDWNTDPTWSFARDLALSVGGIAMDTPANYFMHVRTKDSYRKAIADEIKWANANGLVSMVVLSPDAIVTDSQGRVISSNELLFDNTFYQAVQDEVNWLQGQGAYPTQWSVEVYHDNNTVENQIGADSDATNQTINYVARWVAQNAKTSPMPAGLSAALACK